MSLSSEEVSDSDELDLFREPKDYYAPAKPATFTTYTTKNGTELTLRLVGHNPLWGHLLWNAGQVVARYLEDNATSVVKDKTVFSLENPHVQLGQRSSCLCLIAMDGTV